MICAELAVLAFYMHTGNEFSGFILPAYERTRPVRREARNETGLVVAVAYDTPQFITSENPVGFSDTLRAWLARRERESGHPMQRILAAYYQVMRPVHPYLREVWVQLVHRFEYDAQQTAEAITAGQLSCDERGVFSELVSRDEYNRNVRGLFDRMMHAPSVMPEVEAMSVADKERHKDAMISTLQSIMAQPRGWGRTNRATTVLQESRRRADGMRVPNPNPPVEVRSQPITDEMLAELADAFTAEDMNRVSARHHQPTPKAAAPDPGSSEVDGGPRRRRMQF